MSFAEAIECQTFYADADGDGFGDLNTTILDCVVPDGFVANSGDCDDNNPNIPAEVGSDCNDNDANTDNDVIQADSCTCQGTIIQMPTYMDTCGLADGLVAFFPMDNSPNDIINGNQGTVNGAILTTDRFGNENAAYQFDGVDDFIDYGDSMAYRFAGDYSISLWVKAEEIPQGGTILNKRRPIAPFSQYSISLDNFPYDNITDEVDYVAFYQRLDNETGGQVDKRIYNPTAIITENWHQITVTNDSEGKAFLYVDNKLIDSTEFRNGSTQVIGYPLIIGGVTATNVINGYFKGKIDDIRLYQRFLSREEVKVLYDCEKPTDNPCANNGGDADGDGICANEDCDDSPETGATCSTNCQTFYRDADGDTFGSKTDSVMTCVAPTGYVDNNMDCDDGDINENIGNTCVKCTDLPVLQTTQINSGSDSTFVLFENDFETPIVPASSITTEFWYDVSSQPVKDLFGFEFTQTNTIETILINGERNQYTDSPGIGGNYALGMLNTSILNGSFGDKLAFTFDRQNLPFLNLMMDVAAVDLASASDPNGRYGVNTPIFKFSVYDSPASTFNFSSPGTLLSTDEATGISPNGNKFIFNWASLMGTFDISAASPTVTVVIELLQSGYASFDNIIITSSTEAGSIGNQINAKACETATLKGTIDSEDTVTFTPSFGTVTQDGNNWTWTSPELQSEDDQIVKITATNSCGIDEINFELVVADSICVGNTDFTPFVCTDTIYEVRNGRLFKTNADGSDRQAIGPNRQNINAIGYNTEDNLIYGITDGNNLIWLDKEGKSETVSAIPNSLGRVGGDFDREGNLFIVEEDRNVLFKIDVNNLPIKIDTVELTSDIPRISDIAYNPSDGLFYGIRNNGDFLYSIDPLNGEVKMIEIPNVSNGRFGAVWMFDTESLGAYDSDRGIVYRVNITSGTSEEINNGQGGVITHDAARCTFNIPIDCTFLPTQTFTTQAQLDNFNCDCPTNNRTIQGDLIINGDDINDLSNLSCIKTVTGSILIGDSLDVESNDILQRLDGLGSIMTIGEDLIICNNPMLGNLDGFSNLMEVGGNIEVKNCRVIEYIRFVSLTSVGGSCIYVNLSNLLYIGSASDGVFGGFGLTSFGGGATYQDLPSLVWITGFGGLSTIPGDLFFINVPELESLEAYKSIIRLGGCLHLIQTTKIINIDDLTNLMEVGEDVRIIGNKFMTNLDSLSNLTRIEGSLIIKGNCALENVDGLSNIIVVRDSLVIMTNDTLNSCCGINDLLQNGGVGGPVMIAENLVGCLNMEDINQHCTDTDEDGFVLKDDCDDMNPDIYPGCDDGDSATSNDKIDANCNCVGIVDTTFDCLELMANIGDACDDENTQTTNDIINENCNCVGIVDTTFDCPEFMLDIGQPCDDNDPNTDNEWLEEGCKCIGQVIDGCNLTIRVEGNSIIVENVDDDRNKVYLWDRTFSNLLEESCAYWTDCQGTQTFSDLLPGVYAVQYQSFSEDWTKLYCDSTVYIEIGGTPTVNACDAVNLQVVDDKLNISNLPTLNTIIDVFDEQYGAVFRCVGDCGIEQSIELAQGRNIVRVKVYDLDWNFLCEREDFFMVTGTGIVIELTDRSSLTIASPTNPQESTAKVRVFPNPAKEMITIDLQDFVGLDIELKLMDMLGKVVHYQKIKKLSTNTQRIDIHQHNTGVYQLTVKHQGRLTSTKLIIVR